jgi:hypothetical protein
MRVLLRRMSDTLHIRQKETENACATEVNTEL